MGKPSNVPTYSPSHTPSDQPSDAPTVSNEPSVSTIPSRYPTIKPSMNPTRGFTLYTAIGIEVIIYNVTGDSIMNTTQTKQFEKAIGSYIESIATTAGIMPDDDNNYYSEIYKIEV